MYTAMDQQSNTKEDNSDCCYYEGETEYKMHIVIIGGVLQPSQPLSKLILFIVV